MMYCIRWMYAILMLFSTISGRTDEEVIISRTKWGARVPLEVDYVIRPVKYVIVHHTKTPGCSTEVECSNIISTIQDFHMDKLKFHDIGYNFLIGGDGCIYEGVGWHKVGAHTLGFNTKSLSIAFIGDFTGTKPSRKQMRAFKKFLIYAVQKRELDGRYKLIGARQVSATQSPGLKLYQELRKFEHFSAYL